MSAVPWRKGALLVSGFPFCFVNRVGACMLVTIIIVVVRIIFFNDDCKIVDYNNDTYGYILQ